MSFGEFVNEIPTVALTVPQTMTFVIGAYVAAWLYRTNRQATAVTVRVQ